jgi:hypothetical protein
VETLTCESRQSNPPPVLRWYLGDREIRTEQVNATEEGDSRRWKATSALQHKFAKDDFGKSLMCKVEHPAYTTGVRMATVVLDVLCKYFENIQSCMLRVLALGKRFSLVILG